MPRLWDGSYYYPHSTEGNSCKPAHRLRSKLSLSDPRTNTLQHHIAVFPNRLTHLTLMTNLHGRCSYESHWMEKETEAQRG